MTGAVLRAALSRADREAMVGLLLHAHTKGESGANLLDMLRIQVLRGVLVSNSSLVEDAFRRTFAEVKYFPQ